MILCKHIICLALHIFTPPLTFCYFLIPYLLWGQFCFALNSLNPGFIVMNSVFFPQYLNIFTCLSILLCIEFYFTFMLLYILSYGILSLLILLLLISKVSIFFSLLYLHILEVLLLYHQVRFSLNLCFLEYI